MERHEAPVVSFHTYVNAGSADDPSGATGIAHMFEHMAFKGTETIGTKNYPLERKAMDEVEHIYDQYDAERNKGLKANPKALEDFQQQLKAAMEKADSYVIPNAYPELIEENGGVGLNAGTGEDATNYFYNFPRNRLELWFLDVYKRQLYRGAPAMRSVSACFGAAGTGPEVTTPPTTPPIAATGGAASSAEGAARRAARFRSGTGTAGVGCGASGFDSIWL